MSYSSEVLADSPLAYWRLGDASGTTMADSSGNSRPGAYAGTLALGTTSLLPTSSDTCVDFQNSGHGDITYASWMDVAAFTVEAWVNADRVTGDNPILSHTDWNQGPGASGRSWHLIIQGGKVNFGLAMTDGSFHDTGETPTVSIGTNYHVVGTWDGTTAKVYINGSLTWSSTALSGKTLRTTSTPLRVGSSNVVTGGVSSAFAPFDGRIDEAAIYGTALSATRVAAHYDAGLTSSVTAGSTSAGNASSAIIPVGVASAAPASAGAASAAVVAVAVLAASAIGVGSAAADVVPVVSITADATSAGTAAGTVGLAEVTADATSDGSVTTDTTVVYVVTAFPTSAGTAASGVTVIATVTAVATSAGTATADVEIGGTVTATPTTHGEATATAEAGPRTNPATGGRVRDSYAVATWDPPIIDPPDVPFPEHAYVSADAYTNVTMNGTSPTLHHHIHTQRRRHRDRIVIAGRDITYWRGIPTPIPAFGLVEPLLYGSGSLELPQVVACYETPGAGGLSWLVSGAPVQIQRVKDTSDGPVVTTDWRGILLDFDTSGRTLTVGLAGDATGRAALLDKQPPIFKRRADLGYHWWDDITDIHRPFHPPQGPSTGITLYGFGGMRLLDHMQQLSAKGVQVSGTQWTCMPTEGDGTYRVIRKDTTTIDATAYLDDALTVASLRRDPAEEPNRVFATGVTPGGRRVKFGVYPVLADNQAPVFLGTLHPGDTGDNVTALLVRLYATGYLTAADRPGGYDADATAAVKELQDDAGLPQTGNVNLATWEALFSVGVTGYNLNGSHIEPAAQRDNVRRYLRDAAGNVIGQNTNWDRHALVVDKTLDMGTGITHQQMHAWAREELAPTPGDPGPTDAANNWVGTITFNTGGLIHGHHHPGDPVEVGNVMHARELRPGMNIWLPLFDGGTLLHVSGVNVAASTGLVSATVDTQARDTMKVWEVIARNVETRRDPARAWMQDHRSSRFVKDAVTEFDEVGGTTNDVALPGGWTVFPVVAGQEGTIARLRLELKTPAEFVVAVFGHRITRGRLAQLIGNPLDHAGAKHWDSEKVRRTLDRDYITLYVAGDDQAPCGYYPGVKQVKTWTPQVPNPHYNVSVPADDPDFDNQETIPKQYANPNYNPADPDNDQEFLDVVRYDELTPLTGRWDDDASFGYRTFDDSCVLWVALYTHRPNTLTGGRIMWPQLEAGS